MSDYYECYVVEVWDSYYNNWVVYTEFLDRDKAEKTMSYLLENDKQYYGINFKKYRIVRKTIKQEIVYETGND